MLLKLRSLIRRSPSVEPEAWPLDQIDIYACAAVWRLLDPVPYSTDREVVGYDQMHDDELPIGCYSHNRQAIWLHPDLVRNGCWITEPDGKKHPLLKVYTHEVGHRLAGPGADHGIEFAAIYAFLLSRIPGDWHIYDMLREYDVHTTPKHATPFRRGAKAQNWQEKTTAYALRVAADWGWNLAQDENLTALQAMEIIRNWEKERRERINRRERIEDRFIFAVVALVILAGAWWWMTRPII